MKESFPALLALVFAFAELGNVYSFFFRGIYPSFIFSLIQLPVAVLVCIPREVNTLVKASLSTLGSRPIGTLTFAKLGVNFIAQSFVPYLELNYEKL